MYSRCRYQNISSITSCDVNNLFINLLAEVYFEVPCDSKIFKGKPKRTAIRMALMDTNRTSEKTSSSMILLLLCPCTFAKSLPLLRDDSVFTHLEPPKWDTLCWFLSKWKVFANQIQMVELPHVIRDETKQRFKQTTRNRTNIKKNGQHWCVCRHQSSLHDWQRKKRFGGQWASIGDTHHPHHTFESGAASKLRPWNPKNSRTNSTLTTSPIGGGKGQQTSHFDYTLSNGHLKRITKNPAVSKFPVKPETKKTFQDNNPIPKAEFPYMNER